MSWTEIDKNLKSDLLSIYEEIMWLSVRKNVTASRARSWYTHVMAESVKKRIRRFSGLVSQAAVMDPQSDLRLEHFKRIQTTLTRLVERHRTQGVRNSEEFISTILDCEQVHIVTFLENYEARKAKGDYKAAGIDLVPWEEIPFRKKQELWNKMVHGKVANATEYEP